MGDLIFFSSMRILYNLVHSLVSRWLTVMCNQLHLPCFAEFSFLDNFCQMMSNQIKVSWSSRFLEKLLFLEIFHRRSEMEAGQKLDYYLQTKSTGSRKAWFRLETESQEKTFSLLFEQWGPTLFDPPHLPLCRQTVGDTRLVTMLGYFLLCGKTSASDKIQGLKMCKATKM